MKPQEFLSRDACHVCGQTPCNCTHIIETALNPRDPKADLEAKRKALQDLERQPGADQGAIRQRKLDLEKEARAQGLTEEEIDENLRKWFKEKWVRFGPDGKIRGDCARGDDSEGKPKCLPQAKAHALGKKGRKYAASKKRREDPNPERRGPAKNVATKKKSNEGVAEARESCPECGGPMFPALILGEKQDACYYKVKSRYKVWPSAYASGALVQCRKKGAKNWGNKE